MTKILDLLPGFLSHLEHERQLQPQTLRSYRSDIKQFTGIVGNRALSDVTLQDVRDYMRTMKDNGFKIVTTRRKLHALSTFYEWAMIENVAQVNIARQAQRFAPRQRRQVQKRTLTPHEWKIFVETLPDTTKERIAWGLLGWLGLRTSEVLRLTCGDVDTDQGLLLIQGKGGHERLMPIPSVLLDALDTMTTGKTANDYLLQGDQGGKWSRDSFYKAFHEHTARVGLPPDVTPHWLRHTVASQLAGKIDIFALREFLGHRSTRTTEIYVNHGAAVIASVLEVHPLSKDS